MDAANQAQLSKNNGKRLEPPFSPGDSLLIHRPRNPDNKANETPWGTKAICLECNDLTVKVEFQCGKTDWVHRVHCHRLVSRPEHLIPPQSPFSTSTGTSKTGGGDPVVSDSTVKSDARRDTGAVHYDNVIAGKRNRQPVVRFSGFTSQPVTEFLGPTFAHYQPFSNYS